MMYNPEESKVGDYVSPVKCSGKVRFNMKLRGDEMTQKMHKTRAQPRWKASVSAHPSGTPSSTNAPFTSTEAPYRSLVLDLGHGSTSTQDRFGGRSCELSGWIIFHLRGLQPPREPPPASIAAAPGSAQNHWHPAAARRPRFSPKGGGLGSTCLVPGFFYKGKALFPLSHPSDGWGAATRGSCSPTVTDFNRGSVFVWALLAAYNRGRLFTWTEINTQCSSSLRSEEHRGSPFPCPKCNGLFHSFHI